METRTKTRGPYPGGLLLTPLQPASLLVGSMENPNDFQKSECKAPTQQSRTSFQISHPLPPGIWMDLAHFRDSQNAQALDPPKPKRAFCTKLRKSLAELSPASSRSVLKSSCRGDFVFVLLLLFSRFESLGRARRAQATMEKHEEPRLGVPLKQKGDNGKYSEANGRKCGGVGGEQLFASAGHSMSGTLISTLLAWQFSAQPTPGHPRVTDQTKDQKAPANCSRIILVAL